MNIAGYTFRPVMMQTLCSSPGIFIYTHQATGKSFVRAMRNCRTQRSKNNYPAQLKELLKSNPSEVLLFLAELPKDTKEALYLASRAVAAHLSEKGVLFKQEKPHRGGIYRQLNGEEKQRYTVWLLTHKASGAVFYFEELTGVVVTAKVSQRMLTFNNHVLKKVSNANRVMYEFAKKHFPLDIGGWTVRDLELEFETEQEAQRHITRKSKQHIEAGEVVLNRVSNIDALYYRNTILKLDHVGIEAYLRGKQEEAVA
jgi:hypothetical protein